MLFQHGGDGDGRGQVEERRVYAEGGGMDGGAEEEEDISVGFAASVFAGVGGKYKGGGS